MSNLRNAHVSLSLLGVKGHNDGWSKGRGIGVGILSESSRGVGGEEGSGGEEGGGGGGEEGVATYGHHSTLSA